MKWNIIYYNKEIEDDILKLPKTLLARYVKLTDKIIEYGPNNIGRNNTKALGKGLFELRLKGKEGIARVFYCIIKDRKIYMLHGFIKKTNKIPKKELKLAEKRKEEVEKNV